MHESPISALNQRKISSLMAAILLRFAGLNSIDGNAEPEPLGINRSGHIGYPFNASNGLFPVGKHLSSVEPEPSGDPHFGPR